MQTPQTIETPKKPHTLQAPTLTEAQRKQAEETRRAAEESPVMSFEELRAQTPPTSTGSPLPTSGK
jgi:hypothetical protein